MGRRCGAGPRGLAPIDKCSIFHGGNRHEGECHDNALLSREMRARVAVSLPPSRLMVQSRFIHKILAEHKRRGLHPSRPVTRYIPGEETPDARQSHLSLISYPSFHLLFSRRITRTGRLTWIRCLPPAGQSLLSGHSARRGQKIRAFQPPRQRAVQR